MTQETVLVPDIGGSDEAEVVEVLVAVGDSVEVDQGLLVLESDKASMEIPSTVAGVVVELLAGEGDQLGEGAKVAIIETAGAGAGDAAADAAPADSAESKAAETQAPQEAPPAESAAPQSDGGEAQASTVDVPVPDIGSEDPVDLVELSVAVGDRVAEGDTLVVLESDKASMEVPAPQGGVIRELYVQEGQQVQQGDRLVALESAGSGASQDSAAEASATDSAATPPAAVDSAKDEPAAPVAAASGASTAATDAGTPAAPARGADVYAGPAVRMLAREFGVPLAEVKGSGPRGRILKEDLHAFVQRALEQRDAPQAGAGVPPVPEVDFAAFGPVEVVERSKIDKVTAANMQRSWLNVPHVTQFDDADITDMEAFRQSLKGEAERRGTRLTPLPFLLKACAVALKRHTKINSSLSDGGQTLTYKRYVHIGMAVDTPNGLMVPVIRDVDQKSLWDLAAEVIELAGKARDRKLKPTDMQGAGFSISSLGAIGGRGFTPIVNTPEVAILGVGRSSTQPVWNGKKFKPRLHLPLSLSYDHRVVNGGDAGRFLTELVELLGDIRKQLL